MKEPTGGGTAASASTTRLRRCEIVVDALLFDLDGVLVDSTAAVESVWRSFAARNSLASDEVLRGLHGRRMIDIVDQLVPEMPAEQRNEELVRVEQDEVRSAASTLAIPGAEDLTRQLDGLPWAIVTSGTPSVAQARIAAARVNTPVRLVTGDDVEIGKPSPVPYLTAAAKLGIDPARCLVVEDAPAGLAAAKRAGCLTLALATSHERAALLGDADHMAADLDGVAASHGMDDGRAVITIGVSCLLH